MGLEDQGQLVGAAIIGRPVARLLQDGYTAEVTRLVVVGTVPNGCSQLYGAAARALKALGYRRVFTYTLTTEPGTSLLAAGWVRSAGEPATRATRGTGWHTPTRPREPGQMLARIRWVREL